ncbi:MAG: hypothetical protein GF411_04705 [Candidatus Lokiarchaeota archaeon]|nr:hypothetical protein [Candidatus Lokiarchaeota archaeon]
MPLSENLSNTRSVTLVAVFAAMITVLDSIPVFPGFSSGIWDSWMFVLSPLVGIMLGPVLGAISVGIGTFAGHLIFFRDPFEFFFMFGAPLGSASAGFLYRKKWKPVLGFYLLFLGAYAAYPVSWRLPLWGIWDVLLAFLILILFIALQVHPRTTQWMNGTKSSRLVFSTTIGLELDVLFRIFVFIPGQTYWLFYGFTVEQLQVLWSVAAIITPLKVALATVLTLAIAAPLLRMVNEIDASNIQFQE